MSVIRPKRGPWKWPPGTNPRTHALVSAMLWDLQLGGPVVTPNGHARSAWRARLLSRGFEAPDPKQFIHHMQELSGGRYGECIKRDLAPQKCFRIELILEPDELPGDNPFAEDRDTAGYVFPWPTAARLLGLNRHQMNEAVRAERFPLVEVGGRLVFRKADLDRLVAERKASENGAEAPPVTADVKIPSNGEATPALVTPLGGPQLVHCACGNFCQEDVPACPNCGRANPFVRREAPPIAGSFMERLAAVQSALSELSMDYLDVLARAQIAEATVGHLSTEPSTDDDLLRKLGTANEEIRRLRNDLTRSASTIAGLENRVAAGDRLLRDERARAQSIAAELERGLGDRRSLQRLMAERPKERA